MKTQIEKIEEYMKQHGGITQREALYLGCMRLASRISEMKNAGVKIKTETIKVENVDGSHSYIARYSLAEEGENNG